MARLTMPYFCPILPGAPLDRAIRLPDGSGPYYVFERVFGRRIVLERNPYYRGERTADPDRIVWTIERDWRVELSATDRDENDFTALFAWPDSVVRDLVDNYGVKGPELGSSAIP